MKNCVGKGFWEELHYPFGFLDEVKERRDGEIKSKSGRVEEEE